MVALLEGVSLRPVVVTTEDQITGGPSSAIILTIASRGEAGAYSDFGCTNQALIFKHKD